MVVTEKSLDLPFPAKSPSSRLLTIDLLRGVAAIGVMLYHAIGAGMFARQGEIRLATSFLDVVIYPFSFGFTGVYLFFVISGFCIHLRWVKAKLQDSDQKSLDFVQFWKRRFRRIYPAYIVALVLFVLAQWYLGNLSLNRFFVWDMLSHIFLIHNLDARTVFSLNGVFWTLAIEEQLYLAYFLMVWLRNKYGWTITLAFTFFARIAWFAGSFLIIRTFAIQVPVLESSLANWWIWTLGAVSVEAKFGLIRLPRWCYSLPLSLFIFLLTAMIYVYDWTGGSPGIIDKLSIFVIQPMWGIAFFILVNKIASLEGNFTSLAFYVVRFLAWVGLFSYSLYLVHELIFLFIPELYWPLKALISLVVAWIFYLFFEKPFMNKKRVTVS